MARPAQESHWQALFRLAAKQEGLFSAHQAVDAGCSQQLLAKYLATGRVERVRCSVYRIADFPSGDHEELVADRSCRNSADSCDSTPSVLLHSQTTGAR